MNITFKLKPNSVDELEAMIKQIVEKIKKDHPDILINIEVDFT